MEYEIVRNCLRMYKWWKVDFISNSNLFEYLTI